MPRLTGYLAPGGFLSELRQELGPAVTEIHGRLVLASGAPRGTAWAQNVWLDPLHIPITSITDAARKLRAIQRNWALYSCAHHRRAALVAQKLPMNIPGNEPASSDPIRCQSTVPIMA